MTRMRSILRTTAGTVVLAAAVSVGCVVALGAAAGAGAGVVFSDVPADHPFVEDVEFVAEAGIAGGYADGTYRPGAVVTRQAMAAFLHRANTFRVVTESKTVTNGNVVSVIAPCGPGERVISGGVSSSGAGILVNESRPYAAGTGWQVQAQVDDYGTASWTTTAYAVCGPIELILPR